MKNKVIVLCIITIGMIAITHSESVQTYQTFTKSQKVLKSINTNFNTTKILLNTQCIESEEIESEEIEKENKEEVTTDKEEVTTDKIEETEETEESLDIKEVGEEVEEVEEEEEEVIISGPITGINNAAQSVINHANNIWESTPQYVKDKIIESGYNIYITGRNLEDIWGYNYKIAALTVYEEKAIYIENSIKQVERALTHELGHIIDHIYNSPSCTSEFQDIFNAEQSNFHDYTSIGDGSETSCLTEYFASVFDNVINNNTITQQEVPLSYEYVSRFIYNK